MCACSIRAPLAAKYIGVTLKTHKSNFRRSVVVRLEDDLGEVQLQLGQTMRIFGYLQAADPVGYRHSKVPGFGHTQVRSSVIVHVTLRP